MRKPCPGVKGCLLLPLVLALFAGQAGAAGFALREQNASGAGNAFAGGAASADDASTLHYNPAGMTALSGTQVVVAGQMIDYRVGFSDIGSHINPTLGGSTLSGSDGGDAGDTLYFPNLYFMAGIGDRMRAGIGLNTPFGLVTEYRNGWMGRYSALESALTVVNINPAVAYKLPGGLSLGAGFDAQYLKAKLSNATDQFAVCLKATGSPTACSAMGFAPQRSDGLLQMTGSGWAYGYNAGVLYQATPRTRFGISYRSPLRYRLAGHASFLNSAAWDGSALPAATGLFKPTKARVGIVFPQSASLSVFNQYDERWAFMGDVSWTGWSSFDELRIYFDNPAQPTAVQPEGWKDTWNYTAGANYRVNPRLLLRTGFGYEQVPVKNKHLTARLPDSSRWRLAIGGQFKLGGHNTIDLAYNHLFMKRVSINTADPGFGSVLKGTFDLNSDLVSLQYTFTF